MNGIATAQNKLWPCDMFRTSEVFMPKTLATNDSGRKMTVTAVKT